MTTAETINEAIAKLQSAAHKETTNPRGFRDDLQDAKKLITKLVSDSSGGGTNPGAGTGGGQATNTDPDED